MSDTTFVPGPDAFKQFANICMHRNSMRFFGAKEVPRELLLRLLSLAGHAPSVKNLQPWHFHVIAGRSLRKKLMSASCYGNFVEGAGAFIVVTCDEAASEHTADVVWKPQELQYSCVIAMTHVLLGASAAGLGSCWVSLHAKEAASLLKLKPKHSVVGGIMLGYPAKLDARENILPRSIKPLESTFTIHA
jgi:nitroreductase